MTATSRILIAAGSDEDAQRARAALSGLDLQTQIVAPSGACEILDGAWDALLLALPRDEDELCDKIEAHASGVPMVWLATELSAAIATRANRCGARVCLVEHGPGPLRDAVLRAAREGSERRDRTIAARSSEQVRALVEVSVSDSV